MRSGVVVCDASPLIFLAKLDRLDLIEQVLLEQNGRIVVLRCVVKELLADSANATDSEIRRLGCFLDRSEIVDFELDLVAAVAEPGSKALSQSDQSILRWSIDHRADVDWIVADERLLRRIASDQGIAVIGFLGLLVAGVKKACLSKGEARQAVIDAVSKHGCRISVAVYQRVMAELE